MDAFGNCPQALRHCPKCPRSEGAMGRISDNGNSSIGNYPWMEAPECGQCSTKWYICTLCTALRVHIGGLSNLQAHYRLCHKEDRRPPKKKSCLHATLPRIESVSGPSVSGPSVLGPSVESLDLILEYGIVPPLLHPPFPTSPVLLTQASNTTTTPQPS
jgi:hypothetical protein